MNQTFQSQNRKRIAILDSDDDGLENGTSSFFISNFECIMLIDHMDVDATPANKRSTKNDTKKKGNNSTTASRKKKTEESEDEEALYNEGSADESEVEEYEDDDDDQV